ncbi:MAG: hypothetical protein QG637_290 [Chloroflexota bacterium]|nr:hypothetical protein [Chloroflexota bacterium]
MLDLPVLVIEAPPGQRPLIFAWGVSSFYGWGVNGLNLMLALADHPTVSPFGAVPFGPSDVVLDPLRQARLGALAVQSQVLWDALGRSESPALRLSAPLLVGLGHDFAGMGELGGRRLSGSPTIGVAFLEQASLGPNARERANELALIIAGSQWNETILRSAGIRAVTTVLQGIDTSLFHPAPRSGTIPGERFVIFSGGKLELRKGQDLVLAAFRAFHARHPEALLLAAWHSPWSDLMRSAVAHPGVTRPRPAADTTPDVIGWAVANGIPADSVISVGAAPNIAMPHVIREADVALFPNRAEGGTNLVAMECMACGIPTILSANTGHLDLLGQPDIAIPLVRQSTVVHRDGLDTTYWGESDVEEMVNALETVWRDRTAAKVMGQRAATAMASLDWKTQTNKLLRAIDPLL